MIIGSPGPLANLASHGFERCGVRGGEVLGMPVLASRAAPADTLVMLDPSLIAVAGGTVEIRSSRQASLEMDSAPAGTSFEGASPEGANAVSTVSMYQTDNVAVMAEAFVNWKAQAGAAAALDVSAWAGTSP